MPICACGCGGETRGGVFLPGHDQRLRSNIEEKIGGLLNLDKLVDSAEKYADDQLSLGELGRITKSFFETD